LCRYAEADVTSNEAADKEGLLLVHGFGASGSQWIRSIHALSDTLDIDTNVQCLAPDLIGFGQSEKPPITYTGYCWEAYTGDFIKEVATAKCKWNSFVIGGNSIGGFVSICAAANDATVDSQALSGSGAPGTGKCTGAVLMNPAGVIQTQAFVADIEEQVDDKTLLKSVAQVTAMDALAPCK
jgi:pimeloyl-ACP methyl ester carboxylesterase